MPSAESFRKLVLGYFVNRILMDECEHDKLVDKHQQLNFCLIIGDTIRQVYYLTAYLNVCGMLAKSPAL